MAAVDAVEAAAAASEALPPTRAPSSLHARVSARAAAWALLGAPGKVLRWLTQGIPIPWVDRPPPPFFIPSIPPHAPQTPRNPLQGARPLSGHGRVGAGDHNRVCVAVPLGQKEGGGLAGGPRPPPPEHVRESHPVQIRFAQNPRAPRAHGGLDVLVRPQGWVPRVRHSAGISKIFHLRSRPSTAGLFGAALRRVRGPLLRMEPQPVRVHKNHAHPSARLQRERSPVPPVPGRLRFLLQLPPAGPSLAGSGSRDPSPPRPPSSPVQGHVGADATAPPPRPGGGHGAGSFPSPAPKGVCRAPARPRYALPSNCPTPSPARTRGGALYGLSPVHRPRMPDGSVLHPSPLRRPRECPDVALGRPAPPPGSPRPAVVDALGRLGTLARDLAAPHHADPALRCVETCVGGLAQPHSARSGFLSPAPAPPPHLVEGRSSKPSIIR